MGRRGLSQGLDLKPTLLPITCPRCLTRSARSSSTRFGISADSARSRIQRQRLPSRRSHGPAEADVNFKVARDFIEPGVAEMIQLHQIDVKTKILVLHYTPRFGVTCYYKLVTHEAPEGVIFRL